MKLIPVAQIRIAENRQRREFNAAKLDELQSSIERNGLLQPLVVRYDPTSEGVVLVAGERRLRAIRDLWGMGGNFKCGDEPVEEGLVPCLPLGDLSPLEAFEAELEENIRRSDLSWQEEAEAIAKLHLLRTTQNPNHTVAATAAEVVGSSDGGSVDNRIKQQIQLAKHLDDPDIKKATSVNEAFKILVRKEEAQNNALRAAKIEETYGAHKHTLLLGDCLEWMAQMEPETFDCILTDPPYGMAADNFGDGAGRLVGIDHQYKDDEASFRGLLGSAIPLFGRVCKPAAHLYLCCDIDQFHWLREQLGVAGWRVFRTPIINHKVDAGRVPLPDFGPRRCYEIVLYAFRGARRTTGIFPDVLETRGDDNLGHGAQKPVTLYTNLLRRSIRAGDTILDPFCGTGTIFPAAHELRAFATGIEREPQYFGIASRRLEALDATSNSNKG